MPSRDPEVIVAGRAVRPESATATTGYRRGLSALPADEARPDRQRSSRSKTVSTSERPDTVAPLVRRPPTADGCSGALWQPSTWSGARPTWPSGSWSRRCRRCSRRACAYVVAGRDLLGVLRIAGGRERVRATRRQLAGARADRDAAVLRRQRPRDGGRAATCPPASAALIIGAMPLLGACSMRAGHGDRVAARPRSLASRSASRALAVLVLPGDRPGDAPLWAVLVVVAASVVLGVPARSTRRGRRCPATRSPPPRAQMLFGGAGMRRRRARSPARRATSTPAAFSTDSLIAFVYLIFVGLAARLHGVRLAAPERAGLDGRHLRVREPGGRGAPGLGDPRRRRSPA